MLDYFKLPLEGRHHSGIDDCKNIVKCVKALLNYNNAFMESDIKTVIY